jgi:hypothetical protein
VAGAACSGLPARVAEAPPGALREAGLRAADDPTVRGARLFPEALDDSHGWGIEPGGGVRAIVAGLRVVSMADGSMFVATDRLPATPSSVVVLPERLGGGFLFAIGPHVWRSEGWLGRSTAFFTGSAPISQVLVGLDRVYLRSPQGSLVALDAATGAPVGLGPLPASPSIGRIAALDAWRAVAIADLRGALLTVDAGSTWRPLPLPIEPREVISLGESIAVGGLDEVRQARSQQGSSQLVGALEWWEVRPDGQTSKLATVPRAGGDDAVALADPAPVVHGPAAAVRMFGARPLATAIEDGWPLADGTALVARDGALGRVRLADGALVETVVDAFPLRPSRCHALPLGFDRHAAKAAEGPPGSDAAREAARAPVHADTHLAFRAGDPGALGFVCGEPRGRTAIYGWDPPTGRLIELRRFDDPREVLGFGNGALAVRGVCAPVALDAPPEPVRVDDRPGDRVGDRVAVRDGSGVEQAWQAWCVAPPDAGWRETRAPSDERIVVLADGRVVRVRPPRGGDLSTARLVVAEALRESEQGIVFLAQQPLPADVARALGSGVWLDGFEERRPGIVGGWVDAAGSVVGVEIAADGQARVGEYLEDAGSPVASGRWAFGWTASRRGFETTDGGMTWTKEIAVPDVIASGRGVHERVSGPVGAMAGGWLRVGWGAPEQIPAPEPRPRTPSPGHVAPDLDLECAPLGGPAPGGLPPDGPRETGEGGSLPVTTAKTSARARAAGQYAGSSWGAVAELPPFAGRPGPPMPADDLGLSVEVPGGLEPRLRVPLARVYAWGPDTGDWDALGRWEVRWHWPWGGWQELRSSPSAAAPWTSLDAARRGLGMGPGVSTAWSIVDSDDPDHALLMARRSSGVPAVDILELEAERPVVEARRPGGEPFAEVEGAARMGGRWYVATSQAAGEVPATVVWSIEGAAAREVARVPRAGFDVRPTLRLARHTLGRAVGLVVEGQVDDVRGVAPRWVVAVDVESGSVATPEPLAPVDLSDRAVSLCTGDDAGWELDVAYPGEVRLHVGGRWESALKGPVARMRLSRDRACVERVLGSIDAYGAAAPDALTDSPNNSTWRGREMARTIAASVLSARTRYALRCTQR